jgi:hypothetical protein
MDGVSAGTIHNTAKAYFVEAAGVRFAYRADMDLPACVPRI